MFRKRQVRHAACIRPKVSEHNDIETEAIDVKLQPAVASPTVEVSASTKPRVVSLNDDEEGESLYKKDIVRRRKRRVASQQASSLDSVLKPAQDCPTSVYTVKETETLDVSGLHGQHSLASTVKAPLRADEEMLNDPSQPSRGSTVKSTLIDCYKRCRFRQRLSRESTSRPFGIPSRSHVATQQKQHRRALFYLDAGGSDDDNWEREQILKGSSGIGKREPASHHTLHSQRSTHDCSESDFNQLGPKESNLSQRLHVDRSHPLVESSATPFNEIDETISLIQEALEDMETAAADAEGRAEDSAALQAQATRQLEQLVMSRQWGDELEHFQEWLTFLEDFSDLVEEKLPAIELAEEALEKLEKTYAVTRMQRRREQLQKSHEDLMQLSTNDHMGNIVDMALSNDPEDVQFRNDREKFSVAVRTIFSDVRQEFFSIVLLMGRLASAASTHPQQFKEQFWDLGIRDLISFLVRWDNLLWDPFVLQRYWDDTADTSSVLPTTVATLDKLRWYAPVADFVAAVENVVGTDHDASENLMAYIVFHVVSPRLCRWIEECWDPLSPIETARVRALVEAVIEHREAVYTTHVENLLTTILQRLRFVADNLVGVNGGSTLSTTVPLPAQRDCILSEVGRLAQAAAAFKELLSDQTIQHFCDSDILTQRLLPWLSRHPVGSYPLQPILQVITAPPHRTPDSLPSSIIDFIKLHFVPQTPPTPLDQQIMELVFRKHTLM